MMKRIARYICLLALLPGTGQWALAQSVTKVGTTAAKFLSIPVTPRATAMGGSYVALATDASAAYWNPGGLGRMERSEITVMHSNYLLDLSFDYVAAAFVLPQGGALAISITGLTMPEQAITTIDDPEGLSSGTFGAGSFAVGLSYGRSLTDKFSIGGTAKLVQEKIYNSGASGIALDIGTLFTTPFRDIVLGVSITNFGQKLRIEGEDLLTQKDIDPTINGNNESVNAFFATDRFDLPLALKIGIAYQPYVSESSALTVVVNGYMPNDNTQSMSFGGEYAFLNNMFFLRAGYQNLFMQNNENSYTVGFGINYASQGVDLRFDYAFAEKVHLEGVHQFGLSFRF